MKRLLILSIGVFFTLPVAAGPWKFGPGIPVTQVKGERIYHHLDAAGRKHIALSGQSVAVVWEDNRGGSPQVYAAFKLLNAGRFINERQISQGRSAYNPVVLALGGNRFLIGWEQDGAVWLRVASPGQSGNSLRISSATAGQVMLAAAGKRIYAAWSERVDRYRRIMVLSVKVKKYAVHVNGKSRPVDAQLPIADQLYPTLAATRRGVVVAWEDRRHGHTRLYTSYALHGYAFSKPRFLNEVGPSQNKYDRGSGVTRVVMTIAGKNRVVAAWMDKRARITSGYDIYGATSLDGGRTFGKNEKIQDPFGDATFHAYPAIAGSAKGQVVVVWNDSRDDTHDIWFSWKVGEAWSNDETVPLAAGEGEQIKPAVAMDAKGNLHVVWIEKDKPDGPTTLWYSYGQYQSVK